MAVRSVDREMLAQVSKLATTLKAQTRDCTDLYQRVSDVSRFNMAVHERWERSKLYTVVAVHEALLEAGLRYAESKPAAFAGMVEARGRPAGRPVRKPEASPKE